MLVLLFLLKKNDVSLPVEDEVKSNNKKMFFISLDKSFIALEVNMKSVFNHKELLVGNTPNPTIQT